MVFGLALSIFGQDAELRRERREQKEFVKSTKASLKMSRDYDRLTGGASDYVPVIGLISYADVVTITNIGVGFLAIMSIIGKDFTTGVCLILVASILDGLDGKIARMFGSKPFGAYLDSISDTVSFCFAPGTLLYIAYYDASAGDYILHAAIGVAAIALVIFGTMRLAWFAYIKGGALSYFKGLNTPLMSLIVINLYLLYPNQMPIWAMVLVFMLSFFMLVNIKYPKIRGSSMGPAIAGVVALLISTLFYRDSPNYYIVPMISLLAMAGYIVAGPFYIRYKTASAKQKGAALD